MKVEIVQSENIAELDKLINACIHNRKVSDIKIITTLIDDDRVLYTGLIMLDITERFYI